MHYVIITLLERMVVRPSFCVAIQRRLTRSIVEIPQLHAWVASVQRPVSNRRPTSIPLLSLRYTRERDNFNDLTKSAINLSIWRGQTRGSWLACKKLLIQDRSAFDKIRRKKENIFDCTCDWRTSRLARIFTFQINNKRTYRDQLQFYQIHSRKLFGDISAKFISEVFPRI